MILTNYNTKALNVSQGKKGGEGCGTEGWVIYGKCQ